jgi:hypothetical protein
MIHIAPIIEIIQESNKSPEYSAQGAIKACNTWDGSKWI